LQLLPPDLAIRRLNKPNTTGFAILGLDLAIQAERQSGLFNSPIRRLKPRLASRWLVVPLRRRVPAHPPTPNLWYNK